MNNALKAMNSHLKIASVLVLSIGTLAVGYVAGNRGGGGGVFIPPEDNPTLFEDSNFNGISDRFITYYKGKPLESNSFPDGYWVVDSFDLNELTSGDLSVQFQEYVDKEWTTIDEYPIQFTFCNWCSGSGEIAQNIVDNLCTWNLGGVEGTFSFKVKPTFDGSVGREFGTARYDVTFTSWNGFYCFEYGSAFLDVHTTFPNPWEVDRFNKYDIINLNQEVNLLWEYINALEKCATDVNRDTVVDVNDLLEVVADWGNICETPKGK